jgi:transcriptional regulator with XRE-family HTH domain
MSSTFSKRVKTERERAGLSQTRLARMCDLSGPMISCLERGKSAGSEKVLVSVARALGVSPEWLRSGSGKREGDWSDDLSAFPNAAPQPFPERLKQLRREAGLSQKQLADFVGVSTSAVSCWETGVREVPAGNNLVRLAEALGLDPAEVMKVDGKSATLRNEVQLLAAFRTLPEERQVEAVKLVEALKLAGN